MKAEPDNTIFVTACTHRTDDFYAVMSSARKQDIYVHVLKTQMIISYLWEIKILPLYHHLRKEQSKGKQFVVFFDAYDVIFLTHRNRILERFNEVYQGRVIFNADYPRALYPYCKTNGLYDNDTSKSYWLIDIIQQGDSETTRLLNSGVFAGEISRVIQLIETAAEVKETFLQRKSPLPYAQRLYNDLSIEKVKHDDQLGFWLTMLHRPELFHIDSKKEFAAVGATGQMTGSNISEYRQTTKYRPLKDGTHLGNAVILHSAGGAFRNMGLVYRYGLNEPMNQNK